VPRPGNKAPSPPRAPPFIAKQFPRDLAEVTARMNQACSRLTLAQSATYAFPRGGTTVEGPSIRLAEALIGAWGNAEAGWKEVARHWDPKGADGKGCMVSECVAFCFDKETNVRREISFSVPHTRDKAETDARGKKTGKMLRVPLDSERDIYELCANMAFPPPPPPPFYGLSRGLWGGALAVTKKTLENGDSRPLADIIRSLEAKFREYGVSRAMLEANLGHKLEETTMPEVVKLGKVFNSIADGMVRVKDVFPDDDQPAREPALPKTPASAPASKASARTVQAPPPATAPAPVDGIPGLDVPEDVPSFGSFEH